MKARPDPRKPLSCTVGATPASRLLSQFRCISTREAGWSGINARLGVSTRLHSTTALPRHALCTSSSYSTRAFEPAIDEVPEDEPNLAEEGRVVEYIEDGVPKLGLLLQKLEEHERESKSLWIVGSQDARKFALSQAKFSYVWPEMPQLGLVDGITAQAVRGNAKQLAALAKEAADLRATIAPERLQALWEEAQLTVDASSWPGTHSSSLCICIISSSSSSSSPTPLHM